MNSTRGRRLRWLDATRDSSARDATLLLGTCAWLIYTRLYFVLQPRHLTIDGGIVMWLFNKPDPACGLTRTFAWMWRGDPIRAFLAYPLGPVAFVAVLAIALYCAVALVVRRRLSINLGGATWAWMFGLGTAALGLNWAAKLLWLGM